MPYLIAGPSGAGKTTLARHLIARGYAAVDTDDDAGLAYWAYPDGRPVPDDEIDIHDPAWAARHRWWWSARRFEELSGDPGGAPVFWCGMSENVESFAGRFDTILLLRVGERVMFDRLADPGRDNPWGSGPEMRQSLAEARQSIERRLAALGALAIDADRPVDEVADAVLRAVTLRT
jgi:hypothetical protein